MRWLLVLSLSMLIVSCNKSVVAYNGDFKGHWRTIEDESYPGTTRSEVIFDGKDGAYNIYCTGESGDYLSNCANSSKGKAVISSDHKLIKIGSQSTITLSVDEEPNQVNGQWQMKLNGDTYYKM